MNASVRVYGGGLLRRSLEAPAGGVDVGEVDALDVLLYDLRPSVRSESNRLYRAEDITGSRPRERLMIAVCHNRV